MSNSRIIADLGSSEVLSTTSSGVYIDSGETFGQLEVKGAQGGYVDIGSDPLDDYSLRLIHHKNDGGDPYSLIDSSGNDFHIQTPSGYNRLSIKSSGLVGINNTNPVVQLHVNGAGTGAASSLANASIFQGNIETSGILASGVDATGSVPFYSWLQSRGVTDDNNYYSLALNPVGGNVGVGTKSPDNLFEVERTNDSVTTTNGITITNPSGTNDSRAGILFRNYDNYGVAIYSERTGSTAGRLVIDTNVGAGNITEAGINRRHLVMEKSGGILRNASVKSADYRYGSSAFNDPYLQLLTARATSTYPQIAFEVTTRGNGVSNNESQICKQHGTFTFTGAGGSAPSTSSLTVDTIYHSTNNGAVNAPTLALVDEGGGVAGLYITPHRQTNYDSYYIEIKVWNRSATFDLTPGAWN